MNFESIKDEFLKDLDTVISINSINGDNGEVSEKTPLGKGVNDALCAFLKIGEAFGFKTKNLDGYAAYIECGEGEKTVGIIAHVDTVAVGDGWDVPPLRATIKDGGVYGRGVTDDKGPALLALYAMREAQRMGKLKDKRVRLILGGDEESGSWQCMKRYKKTESVPDISFSPDAEYPVVFGEKGLLKVTISAKETSMPADFKFDGGTVINIVPDKAQATVNGTILTKTGLAAHGSLPHKGVNAVVELGKEIAKDYPQSTFAKLISLTTAEALGIDISDKFGTLSINPSILKADNTACALSYDIRYPITADGNKVISAIKNAAEEKSLSFELLFHDKPLYVPLDSHLVKTLSDIYNTVTGDDLAPISIGGGTYAKAFDNCVAFGVMCPDDPETMHAPNEFWSFQSMGINYEIITKAIIAL